MVFPFETRLRKPRIFFARPRGRWKSDPDLAGPNGNCQNNLEVGDVIENLPNGVYSVTLHGFTYHPQNVAILQ
jgi:hypothetical protein